MDKDKTSILLIMPTELKDRLEAQARREDRSMSSLLRQITEKYLAQQSKNGKNGTGDKS